MESVMNHLIVGLIFIICSTTMIVIYIEKKKRLQIIADKAKWDLQIKVEKDKKNNMKEYFLSYKIPLHIKGRFLREYPQYKQEDYKEIEQALLDYFWLFLPENKKIGNFYTFPSKVADDLWHTFLLYSKEYREFCENSFGYVIDHIPHTDEEPENSSFETVLNTHRALTKDGRTAGFDLDKKHNVENKYDNTFINEVEEIQNKSNSNRSAEQIAILAALGLAYYNNSDQTKKDSRSCGSSGTACGSLSVSCGSTSSKSSSTSCGSSSSSSSSSCGSSSSSSCGSSCGGGGCGS